MNASITLAFVSGLLTMGYTVAAVFFLRFWHRTRDRLFAIFAGAFGLLALQRLLLGLRLSVAEDDTWYYGLRLLAFVLIVAAVLDKNRGARRR